MPDEFGNETEAEKLNSQLARFSENQKASGVPTEDRVIELPQEEDESLFSKAKGAVGGALDFGFDMLTMPGDMASLGLFTKYGDDSAESRQARREVSDLWNNESWFSKWRKLQEVQHERPSQFFGEKLITATLFDPLTYAGFGMFGKIPLAGKLLGPMEQGYISVTNRTVQGAVKALSAAGSVPPNFLAKLTSGSFLPGGAVSKLVDSGKLAPDVAKAIRGTWLGSAALSVKTSTVRDATTAAFGSTLDRYSGVAARNMGDAEITKNVLKQITQMSKKELHAAGDGVLITRNALDSVGITQTQLNQQAWIKTVTSAADDYAPIKLTAGLTMDINDMMNSYLRKEVQLEELVEGLVTKMGGNVHNKVLKEEVNSWVLRTRGAQENFINKLGTEAPAAAIESLGAHSAQIMGEEIKQGINLIRQHQGMWGGFLSNIDNIYSTVWRSGIEKWLMRPMSEAVLANPAYPIGNIIEDMYFMASGGAIPRGINAAEFNRVFQGVNAPELERMRRSGRTGVGEIAQVLGERRPGQPSFIPSGGKLGWFGRKYLDASNKFGELMKRGFYAQRMEFNAQMGMNQLGLTNQSAALLNDTIDAVPNLAHDGIRNGLVSKVRLLISAGDVQGVRNLSSQYTQPVLQKARMLENMNKYTDLAPETRSILKGMIEGGDFETLVTRGFDAAIDSEQRHFANSISAQTEWFDNVIGTFTNNPPKNSEDMLAMMMDFSTSVHSAQNIMHANMQATFDNMGASFGNREKKMMKDAYDKAEEFTKLLEKKVPEIAAAYSQAAAKFGVDVSMSKNSALKLSSLNRKYWDIDIAANRSHFGHGGNAVDWRAMRHIIWAPHDKEYSMILGEAQASLIEDASTTVRLGSSGIDALRARIGATPASAAIRSPAGITGGEWARKKTQLVKLQDELRRMTDAPLISQQEVGSIETWTKGLVDQLTDNPALGTEIQKAHGVALERTMREGKQAFTSYDNEDSLDFMMKHIFPFWTYAKNIWPRLITNGIQHPAATRVMSPDGAFWSTTDGGYLPQSKFGAQFAPYRGLGVGRLKNAFRQQFDPRQEGALGTVEEVAEQASAWGFFPGWPWQQGASVVASVWGEGEYQWGANIPPLWDTIVNLGLMTGAAANVPGTVELYESLRLGRFKEAAFKRTAFSLGLDPNNLTDEDKNRIIKRQSAFQVVNNAVSMFRERPEFYQEYRQSYQEAISLVTGVSVDELNKMRDDGRSIFEEQPLDPFQRETLRDILSDQYGDIQSEYASINEPFRTMEEQEIAIKKRALFDRYDQEKILIEHHQNLDDVRLEKGDISARTWRDNLSTRGALKSNAFQFSKDVLQLTDEDFAKTNKSPLDALIDVYFSTAAEAQKEFVDPITGFVQWDKVEEARDVAINNFLLTVDDSDQLYTQFETWQFQNETPLVQEYRLGSRQEFFDWFNTDAAIDWFTRGDTQSAERLKKLVEAGEGADKAQRVAIASGQPRQLANLLGRSPGEEVIKDIVESFRAHLLAKKPGIDQWLRRFFEIAPR